MLTKILRCLWLSALVFAASTASAGQAPADGYRVRTVVVPGADSTTFWDINDRGQIVGDAALGAVTRPFVFEHNAFRFLDIPFGGTSAWAAGISNDGLIVGTVFDDVGGSTGYLFDGSAYMPLNLPGGTNSIVRRISSDGRYVTGYADTAEVAVQGFVLDRNSNQYTLIDTLDPLSVVQGVTNGGVAVGSVRGSAPGVPIHAFTFDSASGQIDYPTVGSFLSPRFRDINDSGFIAGFDLPTGTAFVFRNGDVLQTLSVGDGVTFAYGINNFNRIVGYYQVESGQVAAFLATPVPEPGAWLLLSVGLLALVAFKARRAR